MTLLVLLPWGWLFGKSVTFCQYSVHIFLENFSLQQHCSESFTFHRYLLSSYILLGVAHDGIKLLYKTQKTSQPTLWGHKGEEEIRLRPFLTWAQVEGEWSISRPDLFTPEKYTITHWIGGWLGPRTGLDYLKRRTISGLCRNFIPQTTILYQTHASELVSTGNTFLRFTRILISFLYRSWKFWKFLWKEGYIASYSTSWQIKCGYIFYICALRWNSIERFTLRSGIL